MRGLAASCRQQLGALFAWVAVAALALGCAATPEPDDGLGTFTFALTGTLPDVTAFRLAIYEGPLQGAGQPAKFALACAPYLVNDDENRNAFTLNDMPAGKNYSVLVEYFADAGCSELKVRAYRGGVEVRAGSGADAAATPYYLQPVRVGGFAGMAIANDVLKAEATQRSCSTDQDCAAIHPAATCTAGESRCNVDSLFPLNGGAKRAFPSLITLADGSVALTGGFSVVDAATGVWTATTSKVERFVPSLGRFDSPSTDVDNFDAKGRVGLAGSLPLAGSTFGVVGGQERAGVAVKGGKLETSLQDATCTGASATCPTSKGVWRVDLPARLSAGTELAAPVALPIVARVAGATGTRVLVAGGADVPVPKSGSSRTSAARLCELSGTSASCESSASQLTTPRAGAAWVCLESSATGCKSLLIVGGRAGKGGSIAEQYDAADDSFTSLQTLDAPAALHGGHLVKVGGTLYLLGAMTVAPFLEGRSATLASAGAPPYRVVVDDSGAERVIKFEPVDLSSYPGSDGGKRVLASAIGLSSGHALLIGGIDPQGKVAPDALVFDEDGFVEQATLEVGRFGAAVAEIGGAGPFGGCALLAGGGRFDADGTRALSHVELYCPK